MSQRNHEAKNALKQELEESRILTIYHTQELFEELDFVSKIKHSVQEHPLLWTAGTALGAAGLFKFLGFSRKKATVFASADKTNPSKSSSSEALKSGLLSIALGLALPPLKKWATSALLEKGSQWIPSLLKKTKK